MDMNKTMEEATPQEAHEALDRVGKTISDKEFKRMVQKAASNI